MNESDSSSESSSSSSSNSSSTSGDSSSDALPFHNFYNTRRQPPNHHPNRADRKMSSPRKEYNNHNRHDCPIRASLQRSEFFQITKIASGVATPIRKSYQTNNISQLMQKREIGYPHSNFSKACKSRIFNTYLPNAIKCVDYYPTKIFCGIFSKEGYYYLTAAQDRKIRLYDSTRPTYKFVKMFNARDVGWSILDIAFSPSETHFVYSTWSRSLHLCSIKKGDAHHQPICLKKTNRRFCIFSVVFSSSGREILGAANDGTLHIFDLVSANRVLEIEAHDNDVNTVAFADNSCQIIYSAGDDGVIKVWDRRIMNEADPKPVGILAGHLNGITFIDSRGDGRHLISNSKDQTIKLWDIRVFSTEKAVNKWKIAVNRLGWDYRWQEIPQRMFIDKSQVDDASVMTYRGHSVIKTLLRCRFSPVHTTGQRFIYTGSGTGGLVVYDAITGDMEMNVDKQKACTRDVYWHPHRNEILTCSWDGTIGQWTYRDKSTDSPKNANDDGMLKISKKYGRKCFYPYVRE